ncbi:MAG: DMT family transporter [Phycisphaeraceae bacterium]|nr:DMT family transporter [Phycisphaeraceae bacterium]
MTALCIALAVVAGILLPLQAGVNATLRSTLAGPVWATFANFVVGATASVAFDHFGILGAAARELTPARALGVALLLGGMALVLRG